MDFAHFRMRPCSPRQLKVRSTISKIMLTLNQSSRGRKTQKGSKESSLSAMVQRCVVWKEGDHAYPRIFKDPNVVQSIIGLGFAREMSGRSNAAEGAGLGQN